MSIKTFVKEHRIFLVILLFALMLRLFFLPYAKFENETVRDLTLANQIIDQKELRLKGISSEVDPASMQQSFGPLFYYMLAFSQLIYRHPYSVVGLIIAMTLIGVALFYFFIRSYYDDETAIFASALFAFSPWVFAFVSLNFATPSFLLFFVILLYFSLFKVVIDKKNSYLTLTAVALAAMLQIHLSSVLLLPISFFYLILLRPSVFKSKHFLLALGVALLFFMPFIINAIQNHSFQNVFDFLFSSRTYVSRFENFRDSLAIPFMLATMYFGPYLLGSLRVFAFPVLEYIFIALDIAIVIAIGLGLLYILRRVIRNPDENRKVYILVLGWLILPIILAIIPGANVSPHYMYITYPSQFLLLAIFFKKFITNINLRRILFLSTIVVYLVYVVFFYFAVITNGGTDGIYGIPLRSKIDVLEYVSSHKPNGNLLFYSYVKPEYKYLQPYYAPNVNLFALNNDSRNSDGYLLLDFYSRGNFGEQEMTQKEQDFYQNLPAVKIGQISLVDVHDYKIASLSNDS